MISYQAKVLAKFEDVAACYGRGLPCTIVHDSANTGDVLAQKDSFITVARLNFHFQQGHNTVTFNGHALGPDDWSCRWAEHEDEKVTVMFAKWARLCRGEET